MTDFEKGKEAYDKGDYITAFHILEPLANDSDLEAMLILGSMFETGQQGIPQNYSEAFRWFQRSAYKDDARGLFKHGLMYYNGWGTPQNYREARKLFIEAAEKEHAEAQYYLGVIYEKGYVNSKKADYILAHMLFNISASKGYKKSVERRDAVAKEMSPKQIEEAHEKALVWFEKYSKKDNNDS